MRLGPILVAAAMTALPAFGEVSDADGERVAACFEAREWNCAFDGMVNLYETSGAIEDCLADSHHGCSFELLAIYVSGIGASENASVARRREIAQRALSVVTPMSAGQVETEGEIIFSALQYDFCKTTGDRVCMAESANLIGLAIASGYDSDWDNNEFGEFLSGEGVGYPVDLETIVQEVAAMEPKE